jgi:1,2-diacylglycerol 3-alpha-glucosyltransferase
LKIAMFTNTYVPHVGGVARSVERFTTSLRERGHRVLVVAPEFSDEPQDETDVVRVPALQNFNGSDFSAALPLSLDLRQQVDAFEPEVIHSHHPYLLGDTALRIAAEYGLPMGFTHHTFYEHYTHYVPLDSDGLRRFVVELSTRYANLCDAVIAPSGSVRDVLRERQVTSPITVLPTGIDPDRFAEGDGDGVRERYGIDSKATVIGHIGRLALEKNLDFLTSAILHLLDREKHARALIVGDGDYAQTMKDRFSEQKLVDRVVFTGSLSGQDLIDAYHAMDVFAFASKSETQGMVLVEALACGVPVVAIDASGARDVVRDGVNGRLLETEDPSAFADALWHAGHERSIFTPSTNRESIESWHMPYCAERLESLYVDLVKQATGQTAPDWDEWEGLRQRISREWDIWSNRVTAIGEALTTSETEEADE